jgi:hypothetical protein
MSEAGNSNSRSMAGKANGLLGRAATGYIIRPNAPANLSGQPYCRGYLKLSLVSCLTALHAACSSSERISFRQINRRTGNRLGQQLLDEETREAVDAYDKGRSTRSAESSSSSSSAMTRLIALSTGRCDSRRAVAAGLDGCDSCETHLNRGRARATVSSGPS